MCGIAVNMALTRKSIDSTQNMHDWINYYLLIRTFIEEFREIDLNQMKEIRDEY